MVKNKEKGGVFRLFLVKILCVFVEILSLKWSKLLKEIIRILGVSDNGDRREKVE